MFNQQLFLDSCNNLAQGDEMCHNMETSYVDFEYDAYIQLYPDTNAFLPCSSATRWLNESLSTWDEYYNNGLRDNAVVKPEDDDPNAGEMCCMRIACK